MSGGSKRPADWGKELPDDPPSFVRPEILRSGIDLSRDPDEQMEAHPPKPLDLSKPLTPQRRVEAADYGALSALFIAAMNLAGLLGVDHRPMDSLIGTDPDVFITAQCVAAAFAVGLAIIIWNRASLWACEIAFAWSVLELVPYETGWLYGHRIQGYREYKIAVVAVGLAMVGVYGAWAIRRAKGREKRRAAEAAAKAASASPP